MGGAIAVRFALDYPYSLQKLCLHSCIPIQGLPVYSSPDENGKVKRLFTKEEIESSPAISAMLGLVKGNMRKKITDMIIAMNSGKHKVEGEELEAAVQGILDMRPDAMVDTAVAFCKYNISDFENEGVDGTNEVENIIAKILVAH